MNRRSFLGCALAVAAVSRSRAALARPRWTAAVIGHSAHGNFGHGLDLVFNHRREIEVLAVADPQAVGRQIAQGRANAKRGYADYREMLERERPMLVSVAPRWTDQHHAMVDAALAVGAHVYCEKPFTQTLAEADDLLVKARRRNLKIAVAHQGRLAPATLALGKLLASGKLGELVEIRVHGKQDRRAGGEDMVVLGTHQFDLVRYFTGSEALWCSARVLQGGRDIVPADADRGTESIGPIAGDEIDALFAFPRGVNVHYTSRAKGKVMAGPWGMEIVCVEGRARLLNDPRTSVGVNWRNSEWTELAELAGGHGGSTSDPLEPNRWVVDDWLAAIEQDREPVCSGYAAMKSLEMIHAVFAAGLSRERVALPLQNRNHPLA